MLSYYPNNICSPTFLFISLLLFSLSFSFPFGGDSSPSRWNHTTRWTILLAPLIQFYYITAAITWQVIQCIRSSLIKVKLLVMCMLHSSSYNVIYWKIIAATETMQYGLSIWWCKLSLWGISSDEIILFWLSRSSLATFLWDNVQQIAV